MKIGNHRLWNLDFFRNWQKILDHSIDLILTDPPLGILGPKQQWDLSIDFAVVSWIFHQLLSPVGQIAIFCTDKLQSVIDIAFSKNFVLRYRESYLVPSAAAFHKDRPRPDCGALLVLHRKNATKRSRKFNHESVADEGDPYVRINRNREHTFMSSQKRSVDINRSGQRFPSSLVLVPNRPAMKKSERSQTSHPSQKSLEYITRQVLLLSDPGQRILDPFAGSATTLVACEQTGRQGFGFELDGKFFNEAVHRLQHTISSLKQSEGGSNGR